MMRLLFLCLLLVLPAATALSYDAEGSGDYVTDDEDYIKPRSGPINKSNPDKTTGVDESSGQMTLIVIIVVATVFTLSIAAIGAVMIVKRHMRLRQQAIYSVPTEQNQKEAI